MKNKVSEGNKLDLVATGNVTSGVPVVMTELVGVPEISGVSGDVIPVDLSGIFELTKLGGEAWTQGQKVYWDAGNSRCTTTASTHKQIGHAAVIAGSADVLGKVKLMW